ncbi:MAG: response regulator transcription factor [Chitinophagaceae bacterium]
MKVLIVEDEPKVSAFLKKGLMEQNYLVETAFDGDTAIEMARNIFFDIIVLDILLPKMNGMDVCREIRRFNFEVPILMLTALGTPDDKVKGLGIGADDYLVKPFHLKEFFARLHALTRRSKIYRKDQVLVYQDLELDKNTKLVKRAGQAIPLTAKEFGLLELFMSNHHKVLSRSFIAQAVWGIDYDTGTNVIDVYVNYLRNKVEKGFSSKLIHTIIGMGYVLKAEE